MKNIHLLLAGESYLSLNCSYRDSAIGTQVGKPYWTYSKDWKHHLSVTDASVRPHNIYITNDEEIKDGDYCIDGDDIYGPFEEGDIATVKFIKIILTTDEQLIRYGVQAIDDEFLEWFVKNPSCERVEVTEYLDSGFSYGYKIIIPKEEDCSCTDKCLGYLTKTCKRIEEPKQEKLEEFIKRQLSLGKYQDQESAIKYSILAGAKWQQEQILDFLYSEITERRDYSASKMCEKVIEFIEQFKNK